MSQALLKAGTFSGKLTSMPMNIEGPILYYRTDILKKCGVEPPATIKDIEAAAKKIKACDATITPFVSRGLKPALAYTFSNMLHNIGGSYMANGKSNLCSAKGKEALDTYSACCATMARPASSITASSRYPRSIEPAAPRCRSSLPTNCAP